MRYELVREKMASGYWEWEWKWVEVAISSPENRPYSIVKLHLGKVILFFNIFIIFYKKLKIKNKCINCVREKRMCVVSNKEQKEWGERVKEEGNGHSHGYEWLGV